MKHVFYEHVCDCFVATCIVVGRMLKCMCTPVCYLLLCIVLLHASLCSDHIANINHLS